MTLKIDTITTNMAKEAFINIRTTDEVKAAIERAAQAQGRNTGNYVLWALSQHDPSIRAVTGMGTPGLQEIYDNLGKDKK